MSNLVNVEGGPDNVRGTGALIRALAEDLKAQASPILADINTREAGQPWGNDHFGETFKTQPNGYFSVPEGAGKPFNEVLKDELANAGQDLGNTGGAVMYAMTDYQSTDGTNAGDITKLR